jgi:hypothetical protein
VGVLGWQSALGGRDPLLGVRVASALRRDLHCAQQGAIGKPLLADQTGQAWCLTVLTDSVITWVTEYYQLAVQDLRAKGRAVPDELLAHISPARSENINFFGVITVDVEAKLPKSCCGASPAGSFPRSTSRCACSSDGFPATWPPSPTRDS